MKDVAWTAYVWPKGRVGNAVQGRLLSGYETTRVRREWERARRVILVHTPGKVGSKALTAAIRQVMRPDDALFHTHRISPFTAETAWAERQGVAPRKTWYTAEFLGQAVQDPGDREVIVVSAVRDPLERNLSAFFQNIERYRVSGRPLSSASLDQTNELANLFRYRFDHDEVTRWVDDELDGVFGTRTYDEPFDHQLGWQHVQSARATVGIIRHDRLSTAGPQCLSELLGSVVPNVPRVNESGKKYYAALYRNVKQNVALDAGLLRRLYGSQFAIHFFTDGERAARAARM